MQDTLTQRSLRQRAAAHMSWAKTADPAARTAPARKAALERFEREIDPDGTMDPAERARRAEHLRKAYFTALAAKSATARRRKRARVEREREKALAAELIEAAGELVAEAS